MRVEDPRRRPALALAALLLLPALALAQKSTTASPSSAEGEIRALEAQRFAAMVKGDTAELERLLAPDLTYTHSSGKVDDRASLLKAISSGDLRYESMATENVTVRLYGDAALVTGRAAVRVQQGGKSLDLDLRYTDVWALQDGRWRLVAWQSTRVAPPEPPAPGKKDG